MEYAVGFLLAIWFVASVLQQFGIAQHLIFRYDIFRVVPRFTFFAPNPGSSDYLLVTRHSDGIASSEWEEVAVCHPSPVFRAFLNPTSIFNKALSDVAQMLVIMMERLRKDGHPPELLAVTRPYLAIGDFVGSKTVSTQPFEFAVLAQNDVHGVESMKLIVHSQWHTK